MFKSGRFYLISFILLAALISVPVSRAAAFRGSAASLLEWPAAISKGAAQTVLDLLRFRNNASENRVLKKEIARTRSERMQMEELARENKRLTSLLSLKRILPSSVKKTIYARVIARSPATWNRIFLIDKGTRQGVKTDMLVLSESALAGKIIESGPSVSKVLLITDPNSKVGVYLQQTRQGGILYGAPSGECRIKYLSLDREIKKGDVVQTAGFGGHYPKGLPVGTIERAWKEPGQIYQVAIAKPIADLSRIEEVVVVE